MGAKLSFELDAGKILAKLHRGGCQLHPDMLYFNTGVIDDANIQPERVDKNKINFDMEGGEYELGVIFNKEAEAELADNKKSADRQDLLKNKELKDSIDNFCKNEIDKNKIDDISKISDKDWEKYFNTFKTQYYKNAEKEKIDAGLFKQLVTKEYAEYVKERDKNNKKEENPAQQDQNAKKDDKAEGSAQDKAAEEKKEKIDKNTPITQNPDEKKTNESFLFEDYAKTTPTPADQATLALMNSTPDSPVADKIAKIASNANEDAKKAIEKNRDIIKKFMEDNMTLAVGYLNEYLKVFAGEDAAKVDAKDVSVTYVPDKFADPYKNKKYDKYQIPALTDEETRQEKIKQLQQMKKTGDNTIKFRNMCFKIAYSLDIGK